MKDELVLSLPKYVGWVGLGWISVLTVMIRGAWKNVIKKSKKIVSKENIVTLNMLGGVVKCGKFDKKLRGNI